MENWLKIAESLDPIVIVLILVLVVMAIIGFRRAVKKLVYDYKNLHSAEFKKKFPEKYHILTNGGQHLILERAWHEGKCVYILDELPCDFVLPE